MRAPRDDARVGGARDLDTRDADEAYAELGLLIETANELAHESKELSYGSRAGGTRLARRQ